MDPVPSNEVIIWIWYTLVGSAALLLLVGWEKLAEFYEDQQAKRVKRFVSPNDRSKRYTLPKDGDRLRHRFKV